MVRHLACEFFRPAAGNDYAAPGTAATRGEPVVLNKVSVALDQQRGTDVTISIFEVGYPTGQIACVDVLQTCRLADFSSPNQIVDRSPAMIVHFVVLMKSCDVPGNGGGNADQKFRKPPQFIG